MKTGSSSRRDRNRDDSRFCIEFAKKNRGEQFFFVNDRFIKSGYLHHAIMAAYDGLYEMEHNLVIFIFNGAA
jgi:DNA mismatch repair ATPase MutL